MKIVMKKVQTQTASEKTVWRWAENYIHCSFFYIVSNVNMLKKFRLYGK
jgi:hypothetical protein